MTDIKMPNEDIWPKILNKADSYNNAMALSFIYAIDKLKKRLGKKDFKKVVESKDQKVLNEFFDKITLDGKKLTITSKNLFTDIAKLINKEYNFGIDIKKMNIDKYTKEYVADLVVEVGGETKLAIKEIVIDGWAKEIAPEKLYKNIKESGIGLDTRRKNSLMKYEHGLIKDKDLSERFKNDPIGWEREIARLVHKQYQALLLDRGRTIGRTESINMANEGSRQMYERAAQSNQILKEEYEMKWVVTPDDRLCDKCRMMLNERCSWGGYFENKADVKLKEQPNGLRRPTLHPRGRCCLVCVRKN